ncbi:xanthine/CO dehydrogenase XdhC/CoxF family maturation factor [Larkinella arboricola]|uniref:Xanthine/CO dehydrogenase XdhC/CoxF family maturation factor n=1 Tax=Larkinella arboricola TaxID=643671 RepID=A0A327WPZ8_LARAB|nr:XdhC/CoxI family protein [Larkinella arboricola]RAJ92977.1 xanthine/CO dehydrogenase XdhC/CoxF family maturation factor [Larkinella arboricola]
MKEINRILAIYDQLDHSHRKVALATVVYVEGSAYRRPGARMLVSDDGRWEGAISGGCLEGDALRKARQVMLNGKPMVVRYDTMDDEANSLGVGLGCNGIIDVFIEPIDTADPVNPITLLREFSRVRDRRVIATICRKTPGIDLREGSRFVLTGQQTDEIPAWLRPDMERVMEVGKPLTTTIWLVGGAVDVFIERMDSGIELVIFGAGYDTIPLTRLATEIGWRVTVTEDCIAHLAPKRFPQATCLLYADAEAITDKLSWTDRTAAVLMSHNYHYDLAVLTRLLSTDVPYIGLLGPRKRYEKMQAAWIKTGQFFSQQALRRVHSPIGLDLGAETPDEIALSILGEIKAFFSGRNAGFLTDKLGPIHERSPIDYQQVLD